MKTSIDLFFVFFFCNACFAGDAAAGAAAAKEATANADAGNAARYELYLYPSCDEATDTQRLASGPGFKLFTLMWVSKSPGGGSPLLWWRMLPVGCRSGAKIDRSRGEGCVNRTLA